MAQWQALSALFYHNEQVRERVNELSRRSNFPYKFRGMFAQWIESQDWFVFFEHLQCYLRSDVHMELQNPWKSAERNKKLKITHRVLDVLVWDPKLMNVI